MLLGLLQLLPISRTDVLQNLSKEKLTMNYGLGRSPALITFAFFTAKLMLISPKTSDTSLTQRLENVFSLAMEKM